MREASRTGKITAVSRWKKKNGRAGGKPQAIRKIFDNNDIYKIDVVNLRL